MLIISHFIILSCFFSVGNFYFRAMCFPFIYTWRYFWAPHKLGGHVPLLVFWVFSSGRHLFVHISFGLPIPWLVSWDLENCKLHLFGADKRDECGVKIERVKSIPAQLVYRYKYY